MNIIQTLLGLLTGPQMLGQIAKMIGVPEGVAQKGLAAAIPAILGGLMAKGSTETGAGALIGIMKDNKIDGGMLDNLGSLLGGATGGGSPIESIGGSILKSVLGGNADAITRLVGSASGMSGDSAGKLMALAAPAVLGGVAHAAPSGGFSPAGLVSLLGSQKEHLEKLAPPGLGALLGLGSLGGLGAAASMASGATSAAGSIAHDARGAAYGAGSAAGNAWSFRPWLAGVGVLAAALFFGMRSCSPRVETPVADVTPPAVSEPAPVVAEPAPAVPEPVAPAPEPVPGEIKLPSGATLNVPPGSVGENLFKFLSGSETGSKTFVFDGLTFDTGRATLDAKSQETITAVTSILKEFPTVTVALDGYTDNQGSARSNVRLSEARAKEVMAALAAAGIDAARLKAAGHGDAKAIADNGTPEGRAQNRRTELTATKN